MVQLLDKFGQKGTIVSLSCKFFRKGRLAKLGLIEDTLGFELRQTGIEGWMGVRHEPITLRFLV